MDSTIVISLITLLGVICSGWFSYLASKKQHDVTIALIEQRLDQLEKKVDIHNNAVIRLTQLEVKVKEMEKR